MVEGTRAYVVFRNKMDVCVCLDVCDELLRASPPPQGKMAHCHSEHGLGTWPGALQPGPKNVTSEANRHDPQVKSTTLRVS